MQEYEERVGHATLARTASDLVPLFTDLPGPHPPIAHLLPHQGQAFAPPPPQYWVGPPQPLPVSDKSKVAAGILQILLPFGVGRFYTGHTGIAVGQLLLFLSGVLTCGVTSAAAGLWCLVDGIVLLVGDSTDASGRPLRS